MKMVRENMNKLNFINFKEESDPISDLGVGAEPLIREWLRKMSVFEYKLTKRKSINVYEGVDISKKDMSEFPDYIKFNHILGGFHCENSGLIRLTGCPYSVTGSFLVRWNKLTSLEKGPIIVKGSYSVSHNQISSLKGLATYIGDSIYLSHNKLTNLEDIPALIRGDFYIHDNPLETLEYFPDTVIGNLSFSPTEKITSWEIRKRCKIKGQLIEYTR